MVASQSPSPSVALLHSVTRVIVHHSASSRDTTKLEDVERWHEARGFRGVGYHFVIEGDARVRVGRPLPQMGAHAKGSNADSVGICIVGHNGQAGQHWTDAQVAAARQLIDALRVVFPTITRVQGHRDVRETECPGLDVHARLGL